MSRSSNADKARQLNAAYRLIERGMPLPEAARRLSQQLGLSRRQAYRYLEQAGQLDHPVEVVKPTVAVTLKLPASTVHALRSYARRSGLTLGEIVTRALQAFLGGLRRHG